VKKLQGRPPSVNVGDDNTLENPIDLDAPLPPPSKKSSLLMMDTVEDADAPPPPPSKKSSLSMMDTGEDSLSVESAEHDDPLLPIDKEHSPLHDNTYLKSSDFKYTMGIMDQKINALYKLCRHIGDVQQENSKLLKKIVAADELSDGFWNVSFNIFRRSTLSFI
jgi:hypothetical protein